MWGGTQARQVYKGASTSADKSSPGLGASRDDGEVPEAPDNRSRGGVFFLFLSIRSHASRDFERILEHVPLLCLKLYH